MSFTNPLPANALSVIVCAQHAAPAVQVATQLLAKAGFAILSVRSIDELASAVTRVRTELLIVGDASFEQLASELDRLALLPPSHKPREIVLLVEDDRDNVQLKRKLPGTKLHVLATPLHAYGLLSVASRVRGKLHQHN